MSQQTQRRIDPAEGGGGEVVAPFLRPSYGPYSVARRKWKRKPVQSLIGDVITSTRELSERLRIGVYGPNDTPDEVYFQMRECTDAQLAALEAFSQFRWSDR